MPPPSPTTSAKKARTTTRTGTIYVEGFPYETEVRAAEALLRELAETPREGEGGKAMEVRATGVRVATWHDSGRLRGYAHVDVEVDVVGDHEDDDVIDKVAQRIDDHKVQGRFLKASKAKAKDAKPTAPPPEDDETRVSKRVFCKNVPYDATAESVRDVFARFGAVADVRIPTQNGKAKGMAYVDFGNEAGAVKAVRAARDGGGVEMGERRLVLDYDEGGPRAGFHRDRSLPQAPKSAGGERRPASTFSAAGPRAHERKERKRGLTATPHSARRPSSSSSAPTASASASAAPGKRSKPSREDDDDNDA